MAIKLLIIVERRKHHRTTERRITRASRDIADIYRQNVVIAVAAVE